MDTPILVTGGTGTLGRAVVPLLQQAGRHVRIITRGRGQHAPGGDYMSGDLVKNLGLTDAVDGVQTVLHLAGGFKGDDVAAINLIKAAEDAGVEHILFVSVVAADSMPIKWFRMKLAAEKAISSSGIPFTTLRAAQFHDLVFTVASKMSKLPVVPAPTPIRFQPVDSRDVAERLAQLTLGEPQGRVPDLTGPAVRSLPDLLKDYLVATRKHRALLPVPLPGKAGRAYRAGVNLSLVGADHGHRTWEAFLAMKVAASADPMSR